MNALIPKWETEISVSSSRTDQEILQIEQGNEKYSVLTTFLSEHIDFMDHMAEALGQLGSQVAVKKLTDKQYAQGNAGKQFVRKNLYISPQERETNERNRYLVGTAASLAVEATLKASTRGILALRAQHDKFSIYRQSYMLLASFAKHGGGDLEHAGIELNKILNGLPVSKAKKKKLQRISDSVPSDLEKLFSSLDSLFWENTGTVRESLTYMLFSISCQKYGEDEDGQKRLLNFYNYLGFNGNYARELLREHAETYKTITDTQNAYLKMAHGMMRNIFIAMPEINVDHIFAHANEMAKYDPYSLRRQRVQTMAPVAGKALAGVFLHHPELVIQAGATALSQFQLEDGQNAANYLYTTLIKKGLPGEAVDRIIERSDEIRGIIKAAY